MLPRRELEPDADGAQKLSGRRCTELGTARQAHERRLAYVGYAVLPCERQAVAAREVEHLHRRLGRVRPDDHQPEALNGLERLAPRDERRQKQVAERAILEQQLAKLVALDRDVAQRLRHHRGYEHRLSREEVQLAEEAAGAVPDDLVSGPVENDGLTLADRDERVAAIADRVEHVAHGRRQLFSHLGEPRHLRDRQHRTCRRRHRMSLAATYGVGESLNAISWFVDARRRSGNPERPASASAAAPARWPSPRGAPRGRPRARRSRDSRRCRWPMPSRTRRGPGGRRVRLSRRARSGRRLQRGLM